MCLLETCCAPKQHDISGIGQSQGAAALLPIEAPDVTLRRIARHTFACPRASGSIAMDKPKSPGPPVEAISIDAAKTEPAAAKPGFLVIAAGILILILEYFLKGLWAFIRFFLPNWMKR